MKWLQQNKWIVLFALIKFIVPFVVVNSFWELHRDEYLYYAQGQHLSFGFLECPPLLAFMGYLSSLAGGAVWTIKFWPALFGALTLMLTASITKQFGGKLFAEVLACMGIFFSGYMRIHYLFQPNFLDIFFWTLSAFYLIKFINTEDNKFLYLLSFALALGWWSKYSVVFFAAAIIIALLFTKNRSVFFNRHFWIASLLGLIIVLPNFAWQYFHNFPLIHHMQELRETQLKFIDKTDFLKDQLLMLVPVAFVWIAGLFWLLGNSKYRSIAYIYIVVIVLLMLGSGKSYYSLGAYPMLLAAGGVCIEKISMRFLWIRYAAIILVTTLALPFLPVMLPMQGPQQMETFNKKFDLNKIGLLKWEDQKNHALQQDFADMTGWKEMTTKAERFYHSLPSLQRDSTVIYCRNYGQAGALKYYGSDSSFVNRVICDNGTFLLWIPSSLPFRHLILVGEEIPDSTDEVFNHFKKVAVIDSVSNPLSRQFGDKIIFYFDADSLAAKLAVKGLDEMKKQFSR